MALNAIQPGTFEPAFENVRNRCSSSFRVYGAKIDHVWERNETPTETVGENRKGNRVGVLQCSGGSSTGRKQRVETSGDCCAPTNFGTVANYANHSYPSHCWRVNTRRLALAVALVPALVRSSRYNSGVATSRRRRTLAAARSVEDCSCQNSAHTRVYTDMFALPRHTRCNRICTHNTGIYPSL